MKAWFGVSVGLWAGLAMGCGPGTGGSGNGDGSGSGSGSGASSGTSDESATGLGTTAAGSSSSSDGADDGSSSSTTDPTTGEPASCGVPPYVACDPLDPTACSGEGSECTFDYHPKGGGWACGCDYGDVGPWGACERTTEPGDDCLPGQICDWTRVGLACLPLCGAELCQDDWVCYGDHCLPPCDPLAPEPCPSALHCAPADDQFLCRPSWPQAPGPVGPDEPCVGLGHCEDGYLCTPDGGTCDGEDCCAAVCDEAAGAPCPAGQVCQPVFDIPELTVGVCV